MSSRWAIFSINVDFKIALLTVLKIFLTGLIGGLAFACAMILQIPIQLFITSRGITDPIQNTLFTFLIYFITAIIFTLILIPIAKKESELKS